MFLLELSRARNIALPTSGSVLSSVLPLLSTDGEEPLRKWPTIGWGRLLMAGLTSEWSLSGDQAQHWRKKEKEIGVGVKKKGERSECSLGRDDIFPI